MNAMPIAKARAWRLEIVGREIARAAIWRETARVNGREKMSMAPPLERFRHGETIEQYDGAVSEAGARAHRVVQACLLDALKESGVFDDDESDARGDERRGRDGRRRRWSNAALSRHSAGLWLRGLFFESGLMRAITMRLEGAQSGGDITGAALYETSAGASEALRQYQRVMVAMARRPAHAVREIACWDRWPRGFEAAEVRGAFDALAEIEGVEVVEE